MKPIYHCWDYNDIPWYMLDNELYTIEATAYEDDYDLALSGAVEYFVYLNQEGVTMITLHKDNTLFDDDRITLSLNIKLRVSSFVQIVSDLCDNYDRTFEPFDESEEDMII